MPSGLPILHLKTKVVGTPSQTARVMMGLSAANSPILYPMAALLYKNLLKASEYINKYEVKVRLLLPSLG